MEPFIELIFVHDAANPRSGRLHGNIFKGISHARTATIFPRVPISTAKDGPDDSLRL